MKKTTLIAALLLGAVSYKTAYAQLSVNVNIGSQPAWGPVGYDYVDYYYMPDIDVYYDVPNHQYVYLNNNTWIRSRALPARYSNYNIYNGYKVVINEREPWRRANVIRTKYVGFKGRGGQAIIKNSKDVKYINYWKPGKGPKPGKGAGVAKGKGKQPEPPHAHSKGKGSTKILLLLGD